MKNILKIYCLLLLLNGTTLSTDINFKKIENWTAADTIDQYDSSNLWEYINGAADLFYAYGFQNLQSCEMSSGDIEVVVDVYNMGSQLNAFGMYKTERGETNKLLDIGVEAVITSPHQSLMHKDIYYIKVNVYEGELTVEKNKILLQSIAEILPGSSDHPSEFELLPAENRINNSENFTKESYLGLSELSNCLYAEYKINESEFQYFVLLPEFGDNYDTIWNEHSKKWEKLDTQKAQILYRKVPYRGIVGIIKIKNRIIGVTNSKTVFELFDRLRTFE